MKRRIDSEDQQRNNAQISLQMKNGNPINSPQTRMVDSLISTDFSNSRITHNVKVSSSSVPSLTPTNRVGKLSDEKQSNWLIPF